MTRRTSSSVSVTRPACRTRISWLAWWPWPWACAIARVLAQYAEREIMRSARARSRWRGREQRNREDAVRVTTPLLLGGDVDGDRVLRQGAGASSRRRPGAAARRLSPDARRARV